MELPSGFILAIFGIIISIIGIFVSIWLYYNSNNKKLTELLEKKNGTLSLDQAKKIADYYLREIVVLFRDKFSNYVANELPHAILHKNSESMRRFVLNTTNDTIRDARNSVSIFYLRGEKRFDVFLDQVNPVATGIIGSASKKVILELEDAIESGNLPSIDMIILIAEDASRSAKSRIFNELEAYYR
ncbi:MAG: hypothetical protein AAF330_00035 [Pseudomonadota bacterium]